jgi:hypothetical protein
VQKVKDKVGVWSLGNHYLCALRQCETAEACMSITRNAHRPPRQQKNNLNPFGPLRNLLSKEKKRHLDVQCTWRFVANQVRWGWRGRVVGDYMNFGWLAGGGAV